MSGKVLIAGGYLVLDPAYTGIVLRLNCSIRCDCQEFKSMIVETQFGTYPQVENSYIDASLKILNIYLLSKDIKFSPLKITVKSDPIFYENGKLGLGSSSALCTSICQSVLQFYGFHNALDLFKISSLSHFMAQGKVGSGFDVAAAVFGSCIYKKPFIFDNLAIHLDNIKDLLLTDWNIDVKPLSWPKCWHILMFSFSTGESTITNSKLYLEWKSKSHSNTGCLSIIDAIELSTKQLITAIHLQDELMLKSTFSNLIDQYKHLGDDCNIEIIPKQCLVMFNEVFQLDSCIGGMCPGAGGKDAVFLVSNITNDQNLIKLAKNHGFKIVNITVY